MYLNFCEYRMNSFRDIVNNNFQTDGLTDGRTDGPKILIFHKFVGVTWSNARVNFGEARLIFIIINF